ncbi:MAG: galactokinase [Bacteroidetes bacterium GWE2_41_25]|nr:MAG: galactokinase [Bacteroidetes bacterium GWA2_40_15]OFX85426.1 MAG: galactokinase [Bacteroidetes bacterium GWC2_40_22]OFY10382.1 MAG: galactokinase [Bacteroidetes bacterium GWE2_41_25]OFY58275.1 MAG: galactokinase [Bacteroidetes bacterium GWF2_41_9]HAM09042.1 galactokinase [Bacteroidales bacterium]
MENTDLLKNRIENHNNKTFTELYGTDTYVLIEQSSRYARLLERFKVMSASPEPMFFSSPGRTEIGGNHTDHNYGRVLAGAVNLDNVAIAAKNSSDIIRIESEGYQGFVVDLSHPAPVISEQHSSAALVRGIASRMKELGFAIGGFDAIIDGRVPKGSGLSSSASFEVLIGAVLSHLFNEGKLDPVENALIGQYAENNYFGKPCGLMDQTACASGGLVTIDFEDPAKPEVRKIDFDFLSTDFALVITDTGGSHDNLTHEYAAVFNEMKAVAEVLGSRVQRQVTLEKVVDSIPVLREITGDRAILRAFHFHGDNRRVVRQVEALENNDFRSFLDLIIESGYSSFMFNQNIYASGNVHEQGVSLALALSEMVLKGHGAWRVHGGGFAGTIQAFVPQDLIEYYVSTLEHVFGKCSCHKLFIRDKGAVKVDF